MKILGIAGSPREENSSGTHTLVRTVLENTGIDHELISLRGKQISGCIACLECVTDNVCKLRDDLAPLRQKIVAADAYVIGAPNYYSTINAATHALLERWFQFRHQSGNTLWGKLAVAVGVGGTNGAYAAYEIEKMLLYNFIETVAQVHGLGAASCFRCGHGDTCQVGIPVMLHGSGVRIADDMIPDVARQADVMAAAVQAGRLLGDRLRYGHDRLAVTRAMQNKMMAMFRGAV